LRVDFFLVFYSLLYAQYSAVLLPKLPQAAELRVYSAVYAICSCR